ncbi:DUF916 domain-containing protein [Candidatus Kaiserbacteria bacterium]|nr:DUF916 domain-containing protein [Candidatus Kaiserbacteria bacterium]
MKQFTAILVCVLLATPLTRAVFAQSPDDTSTSTATTSAPVVDASWYTSERIFGNVDVGDFLVGPGKTELQLQPGDTKVVEISVTNRISDDKVFKLEVENIVGTTDGSAALKTTDGPSPYSITDYISFPDTAFTLDLGERARIPVTISIPADAEPGGYYGSVLVSTVRTSEGSRATQSPIIARVGSLLFITIGGEQLHVGETTDFKTIPKKWWYESGPINFGIVYENTGSVHVNPYGELSIRNMLGEEVGYRELEPWFVLPQSLRTREIEWDREFLLGRYVATVKVNRGYDDIVDERTVVFWVLPWKIVGGIFIAIFVVFFLIRLFFQTFEFKRK